MDTSEGIIQNIVKDLIHAEYEYLQSCETEITEKVRQRAQITVLVERLSLETEVARAWFEKNLQTRTEFFNVANQLLDEAIKRGDSEIADIAIHTISALRKQNIFSF